MKEVQLIVIADDFSGAAEIAGIAFSYGLTCKVTTDLVDSTDCDVWVIDMNSRSLNPNKASDIAKKVSRHIENLAANIVIFKKIDSVLRGNISAEIQAHLAHLAFYRVAVLPANPSIGRYIKQGEYWINDHKLHESSFANDPDFHGTTSQIAQLFIWNHSMPYKHLSLNMTIPTTAHIVTTDIACLQDIDYWVGQLKAGDLICGSGDTFSSFLNTKYKRTNQRASTQKVESLIFVNGSTHINAQERLYFCENNVEIIYWQDIFRNTALKLEIIERAATTRRMAIYSSKEGDSTYDFSIEEFCLFVVSIVQSIHVLKHLIISGGATAHRILKIMNLKLFDVTDQLSLGIVTLQPNPYKDIIITTKPGSYPWESGIINKLCKHIDPL